MRAEHRYRGLILSVTSYGLGYLAMASLVWWFVAGIAGNGQPITIIWQMSRSLVTWVRDWTSNISPLDWLHQQSLTWLSEMPVNAPIPPDVINDAELFRIWAVWAALILTICLIVIAVGAMLISLASTIRSARSAPTDPLQSFSAPRARSSENAAVQPVKGWIVLMSMLGSGFKGRRRLIDMSYHEAQWAGGRTAAIAGVVAIIVAAAVYFLLEGTTSLIVAGGFGVLGLISVMKGGHAMAAGMSYKESTRRELEEFNRKLKEIVITKARLPAEMQHDLHMLALQQNHETMRQYLEQRHRELVIATTQPFKLQMEAMTLPATLMMIESQIRAEDKVAQFESLINRSRAAVDRIQRDAFSGANPALAQAHQQKAAEILLELVQAWAQRS